MGRCRVSPVEAGFLKGQCVFRVGWADGAGVSRRLCVCGARRPRWPVPIAEVVGYSVGPRKNSLTFGDVYEVDFDRRAQCFALARRLVEFRCVDIAKLCASSCQLDRRTTSHTRGRAGDNRNLAREDIHSEIHSPDRCTAELFRVVIATLRQRRGRPAAQTSLRRRDASWQRKT